MKKINKKGFTIVELVIVIAVIAILAGVLIPTFSGVIKKANESKVMQQAQNAYKEAYALDMSDGQHDYKNNGDGISITGLTYTSSEIKYQTTDNKYTATYNSTTNKWTVTE